MTGYIHQLPDWPRFRWDREALAGPLAEIRHRQGRLLGRMEGLGFTLSPARRMLSNAEDYLLKQADGVLRGEEL